MKNTNITRLVLVTAAILCLPLLAMQFTNEVVWDLADFVVAGGLLFGAGLTYELVARNGGTVAYRAAAGVAVAAALLLVWMNLAVGLIGNEENPVNLLYAGVLFVGIIGAFVARFQPRPMASALFATALAQVLVPVIAIMIWRPPLTSGLVGVVILNTFFVALWVVSAVLFRHAGGTWSKIQGADRGRGEVEMDAES